MYAQLLKDDIKIITSAQNSNKKLKNSSAQNSDINETKFEMNKI